MRLKLDDIPGLKVTIMGLGVHGGGIASARFFASLGAEVCVTDLRSPDVLSASMDALNEYPVHFRLGEHRESDFTGADLVIKNPAVPPSSPYLAMSPRVSSDIGVFLSLTRRPVLAITGTKGKSTTASAVAHVLRGINPLTDLGGNITVSPLSFLLDHIEGSSINEPDAPVVLELSSWQLADCTPKEILNPAVSMITNIMHDHQNRYSSFQEYVDDKRQIYLHQDSSSTALFNYDDPYGEEFSRDCTAKVSFFSSHVLPDNIDGAYLDKSRGSAGFLRKNGIIQQILNIDLKLPGEHNRLNMLAAASMLHAYGVPAKTIRSGLSDFAGIPHRLETVAVINGITCINDSAATMPQAAAAAVNSFPGGVHLIAGGTDKDLDFTGVSEALGKTKGIYLLEGDATPRFRQAANDAGVSYKGPYGSLKEAVDAGLKDAEEGDTLLLSPGCASFGMFKNEFDRGDQFRELIRQRLSRL